MRKKLVIWITIALMLIAVSAAFVYGKAKAEAAQDQSGKTYFDTLNDYDWSRTCPAAGCRNNHQEE